MLRGCQELLGGVKVIITVDWIFLALRYDRIRVMLKSIIRYTPGVGWAVLLLQCLCVGRNWAD
ncbi:uncharacterized protein PHALS_12848 [Plasmopara halstedii]|uniref:Uncharacterized protein n=1 Tax=Plasmopara halstedii TaxID=4781 RepID=A0A0P1ANI1_PLAHL|nr:uncharacterized protein PHALS_12848 [Plasmopara halstedii]CEG42586.1 hypothetical protein PHALS_12848 [Plasmopara halstedii]|eukprot:XP_024578955.1 hypothetical protein PHALS_12848 [Plasmopara halstedii]